MVPNSAMLNCNPPSPTMHMTGLSGHAKLAPIAAGCAYPRVPKPVAELNHLFFSVIAQYKFPEYVG